MAHKEFFIYFRKSDIKNFWRALLNFVRSCFGTVSFRNNHAQANCTDTLPRTLSTIEL